MTQKMGRFITLEGIEGVGKTTNLSFIKGYLSEAGIDFVVTREPGGTSLGEALREILLGKTFTGMADDTELLLMFASRAEHIAQVIRPALERGQWVLCDRFTDATYAYQGGGRGLDINRIADLENWVQGALRPDLTLLLDAPVQIGSKRAYARSDPDRFESEQEAFHERVRSCYLERAQNEGNRIKVIDASKSLQDVQLQIAAELQRLIEE